MRMDRIVLGTGVLGWNGHERRSDRYGYISLFLSPDSDKAVSLSRRLAGYGKLVAKVLEIRKSYHIGDLFRGIFPETPEVGEEITLGEGWLSFTGPTVVGLKPDDKRETDWLNPRSLYRLHQQTVELYFIPSEEHETN